jgi:hypothetical protein
VRLSFLIASPMVKEAAAILILGMFGFKVAAMYVVFGLLVAMSGVDGDSPPLWWPHRRGCCWLGSIGRVPRGGDRL